MKYKIENGVITPVEDLLEWARWFETAERRVMESHIARAWISTIFLGLDHQFGSGEPVLFETMIFGKNLPELHPGLWSPNMWRYTTLEKARRGHELACERLAEFFTASEIVTEQFDTGAQVRI